MKSKVLPASISVVNVCLSRKTSTFFTLVFVQLFAGALYAQVGIGTANPKARLHVADSSVVFTANWTPDPGNPPISGTGGRMMWYADKYAFRSGMASGTRWDKENVGMFSTAFGNGPMASGMGSVALGTTAIATGDLAVAIGYSLVASGGNSLSMGSSSKALGYFAIAIGTEVRAIGDNSTAMGVGTIAPGANEMAIGILNTNYVPSPDSARLFVIGNGVNSRSDAFTVLTSGHIGIGFGVGTSAINSNTLSVNGTAAKPGTSTWTITSDARTKKNIKKYSSGLMEVLAINPVRFQYNHLSGYADTTSQYVGVLAQEIEKILPSTVSIVTDDPQVKNKRVFDNGELVYTLINAVKELNSLNATLSKRLSALEEIQAGRGELTASVKLSTINPEKP